MTVCQPWNSRNIGHTNKGKLWLIPNFEFLSLLFANANHEIQETLEWNGTQISEFLFKGKLWLMPNCISKTWGSWKTRPGRTDGSTMQFSGDLSRLRGATLTTLLISCEWRQTENSVHCLHILQVLDFVDITFLIAVQHSRLFYTHHRLITIKIPITSQNPWLQLLQFLSTRKVIITITLQFHQKNVIDYHRNHYFL
jgi:hypothetical protein